MSVAVMTVSAADGGFYSVVLTGAGAGAAYVTRDGRTVARWAWARWVWTGERFAADEPALTRALTGLSAAFAEVRRTVAREAEGT